MYSRSTAACSSRVMPGFLLVLLGACSPSGSFQGKLLDPVTNQPRAEVRLVAKATSGGDVTCQSREATTGADGSFTITQTCADHSYVLTSGDETLILDGDLKITGGEPAASAREIFAWRAPKGDGVYVVVGDTITEVRKSADVYWEPVFPDASDPKTYEKARYASEVPKVVPRVPDGGHLAIAGEDNVKDLYLRPLIAAEGGIKFPRPDKDPGSSYTISDASWVGLNFKTKTISGPADLEKVEPVADANKVKDLKGKGWSTRMIAADALPPGRYAVLSEFSSRMYIVDLGGAAEAAATTEGAAEGAAEGAPATPSGG